MSDVVTFLAACLPGLVLGWISADAWHRGERLAGAVVFLVGVFVTFVCLGVWFAR